MSSWQLLYIVNHQTKHTFIVSICLLQNRSQVLDFKLTTTLSLEMPAASCSAKMECCNISTDSDFSLNSSKLELRCKWRLLGNVKSTCAGEGENGVGVGVQGALPLSAPEKRKILTFSQKHCQRHNGPEGWVHIIKVTSWGHITSSNANLDQIHLQNLD